LRPLSIQKLNISTRKIRLEEIRGMVGKMKFCSECIFQGGDIDMALKHLSELQSDAEKKFLFCYALVAGDSIDKSAAKALLLKLNPAWRSLGDVLPTLPLTERKEILKTKSIMDVCRKPQTAVVFSDKDKKRISLELSKAVIGMGSLPYKDAVWILIPERETTDSLWVQGHFGKYKILSEYEFADQFSPNKEEEKLKLLSCFRSARWVLHIHNHPAQYAKGKALEASAADHSFSIQWKEERPDLGHKMKFFIVAGKNILEYSMMFNKTKIWDMTRG